MVTARRVREVETWSIHGVWDERCKSWRIYYTLKGRVVYSDTIDNQTGAGMPMIRGLAAAVFDELNSQLPLS